MKHYHIKRRNWFLIDGKTRPVTGLKNQYVMAQQSSEHPNSVKFDSRLVEPLTINKELIEHSNLRNMNDDDENVYDSLRLKHETISLPFIIRFNYESDEPCEITFPLGDKVKLKYIHRLQQFVYAVTGEEMRIRM